jgi:precorrin-6A/cobalt-precorrin-6A reductase
MLPSFRTGSVHAGSGIRLWLIGGTSESRAIAQRLDAEGLPWVATVTRPQAVALYTHLQGTVRVGSLDASGLPVFLEQNRVRCIVDASHPFAREISHLAIASGLPYLRFERPASTFTGQTEIVPDFAALLCDRYLHGRRVLLTVGTKALPLFVPWHGRSVLFARILPGEASTAAALAAGFPHERLICRKLPLTCDEEMALWRSLAVDTVVSKESGEAGGLAVKCEAARILQVRLVVVARPPIAYPEQTDDPVAVVAFCRNHLG